MATAGLSGSKVRNFANSGNRASSEFEFGTQELRKLLSSSFLSSSVPNSIPTSGLLPKQQPAADQNQKTAKETLDVVRGNARGKLRANPSAGDDPRHEHP